MIDPRVVVVIGAMALLTAACGPKYPSCETDSDCQAQEYCVNSRCQQCRDHADCPDELACKDGACAQVPGFCRSSDDCGGGQVCRDHRCSPCLAAGDCADGMACIDGACVPSECASDADCPAGLACVGYRCQPSAAPTSAESECDIESIYFAYDSAQLDEQMRRRLQRNYECLVRTAGRITLEGHCDPRGTTEYNMALGERRAQMARKLLKAMGIDPARLRTRSKGEEEAAGYDKSTYAKDRRVDFE